MGGAMPEGVDRRAHTRVMTRFDVHCRRLGRSGVDQEVEVVDLSMGGMRITSPIELHAGDVVQLTINEDREPLVLSGLVVGSSAGRAEHFSHIAFTRVGSATLEEIGQLVDRKAAV